MMDKKSRAIVEFGDFQTPAVLARRITVLLSKLGVSARSVIEPTCGRGSFVVAVTEAFPRAEIIVGVDINSEHLCVAQAAVRDAPGSDRVRLQNASFFEVDWNALLESCPKPWLIIGNPPWVTSSELAAIGGENLPLKSNFHGRQGIEAITGKSNFDISEWMLLQNLNWLKEAPGTIAVLCKTAVARKILTRVWKHRYPVTSARIYQIDAFQHFGASVDACLFVLQTGLSKFSSSCDVFDDLDAAFPVTSIGYQDGLLLSDVSRFERRRHLYGADKSYVWRSGIKHDCSKVMELTQVNQTYRNGFGMSVGLEDAYVYPLLKSSDIGNGRLYPRSVMLVPQRSVGEQTAAIQRTAPRTWEYLERYAELLANRGSSIYRGKPRFSIFGVGPYSFASWKVAISGFYKRLRFECIGPYSGKPVVLDDTVYFLPCKSENEAQFVRELLSSLAAREFYESMIFWSDKRPITVDVLKRLSFSKLSLELGRHDEYLSHIENHQESLAFVAA